MNTQNPSQEEPLPTAISTNVDFRSRHANQDYILYSRYQNTAKTGQLKTVSHGTSNPVFLKIGHLLGFMVLKMLMHFVTILIMTMSGKISISTAVQIVKTCKMQLYFAYIYTKI